jgi:hypothetical protein
MLASQRSLEGPRTRVRRGVDLIRLDAFGYTTKKRGTNCFFVEPEVWQLLDRVKATLAGAGTELLCEVHEHYSMQKRLAERGLWVYDFALPLLSIQVRRLVSLRRAAVCSPCCVLCVGQGLA